MSAGAITKEVLEALIGGATSARVTLAGMEVLIPTVARSPTTPTGAGASLVRLEALVAGSTTARVTQVIAEVLVLDTSARGEPGAGTVDTIAFGYAV
jgi:hypothetical protein